MTDILKQVMDVLKDPDTPAPYQDQAVFIVAGGPTLSEMNLDLLNRPGIMTFGLNNSPSVFRTNMQVSVDQPSKFLTSVWEDPRIMKFCKEQWANNILWDAKTKDFGSKKVSECPNVVYWEGRTYNSPDAWNESWFDESHVIYGNSGTFKDENGVKQHGGGGRSVMVAAIKLSYLLGFRRVYLLGSTFLMTATKAYGFEQEVWESKVDRNNEQYGLMMSRFTRLIPGMKKRGFEIHNCDPGSFLTLFPWMTLEDAIEKEQINTDESTADRYGKDQEAHDFTAEQVREIKKLHAESTEEERSEGRYWRTIGEKALGQSKGNGCCAVAEGRVWRDIT